MHGLGQNITRAKQSNLDLVMRLLLKHAPMTRQQLAGMTRLTPPTITNLAAELMDRGCIRELGKVTNGRKQAGRKSVALDLHPDGACVLAIHMQRVRITLGLVNLKGDILASQVFAIQSSDDADRLVHAVSRIQAFVDAHAMRLTAIGIGSYMAAGHAYYDSERSEGMPPAELIQALEQLYTVPIVVDNNVRGMALAEKMYGSCKEASDFFYVFMGYGLGSSLVLDDRVQWSGLSGAGEMGHSIYDIQGRPCHCGQTGCLHQYVSSFSLCKQLKLDSIDEVIQSARAGDVRTLQQLELASHAFATVLMSNVNTLPVQRVILSGELVSGWQGFVDGVQRRMSVGFLPANGVTISIEPSAFGTQAGVMGSAAIALYKLYFERRALLEDEGPCRTPTMEKI